MSDDFRASKSTMIKALQAMKETEYPKQEGESRAKRMIWEAHHQECISKLAEMILEGRYQ